MKKTKKFIDWQKINLVASFAVLVSLIVALLCMINLINIRTNKNLSDVDKHLQEIDVDPDTNASCSASILKKAAIDANDIKFEVKERIVPIKEVANEAEDIDPNEMDASENYGVDVVLSGIKPDYIFLVENDLNDDTINFKSEDAKDGKYSFFTDKVYEEKFVKYKITIQYNGKDCTNETVKKYVVTAPKFNPAAVSLACVGKEKLDECKMFTYSELDNNGNYSYLETIEKVNDTDVEKAEEEKREETKKNKTVAILVTTIILVIALLMAIIGIRKISKGGALHSDEIDKHYDENTSKTFEEYEKEFGSDEDEE